MACQSAVSCCFTVCVIATISELTNQNDPQHNVLLLLKKKKKKKKMGTGQHSLSKFFNGLLSYPGCLMKSKDLPQTSKIFKALLMHTFVAV